MATRSFAPPEEERAVRPTGPDPHPTADARPGGVLGLQQTIGNRATVDALRQDPSGLPGTLRAGVENLSGVALAEGATGRSGAPAGLHALAYAQGTDIHVGPQEEQHLPHEAWHVVQQAQGRVQPTQQL